MSGYPIICSDCGAAAVVPFEPKSNRPVKCPDCFKKGSNPVVSADAKASVYARQTAFRSLAEIVAGSTLEPDAKLQWLLEAEPIITEYLETGDRALLEKLREVKS